MNENRDNKKWWNRYAKLYDFQINRSSGKAYREMARIMANSLSPDMDVLEVATGTGMIAISIAACVRHYRGYRFLAQND